MKEFRLTFLLVTTAFLLTPSLALAHHSAAAYESTKQIAVSGVVTEFHFVNPHVLIYWTAKDEEGHVQKWQGELTSPNHLIRSGWNKEIIKAGDEITLTGYPAKNGAYSLRITKVVVRGQALDTSGDQ
jgi:Family of unknown function (DUF6152)